MNEIKAQEWVIDEDELELENSILEKHKPKHPLQNEKKIKKPMLPIKQKASIIKKIKKTINSSSNISEEFIFFLIVTMTPYIIGLISFFVLILLLTGININILFSAIDFFDWVIHFLFWSIGYMAFTFLGVAFIIYKHEV